MNPFPVNCVTVKRAKHGRDNLRRNWIVTQPQVGWVRSPLAGWSAIRGRRIFVCRTWQAAQDVADAITSGANPGLTWIINMSEEWDHDTPPRVVVSHGGARPREGAW